MNIDERLTNLNQLLIVSERKIILEQKNRDRIKNEISKLESAKNINVFKKIRKKVISEMTKSSSNKSSAKKITKKTSKKVTKPRTTNSNQTKLKKKKITNKIMKDALKKNNIKFSSKSNKAQLEELIRKHCLVRYCESII